MNIWVIITSILLGGWFLGAIITYKFGKYVLVEGMGAKSPEFLMLLLLFSISFAAYLIDQRVGQWILIGILLFWLVIQFFCHWYFTLFGASEKKLNGYNECFHNTVRLFRQSDSRIVPDFYHIVLHLLILCDLVLVIIAMVM